RIGGRRGRAVPGARTATHRGARGDRAATCRAVGPAPTAGTPPPLGRERTTGRSGRHRAVPPNQSARAAPPLSRSPPTGIARRTTGRLRRAEPAPDSHGRGRARG